MNTDITSTEPKHHNMKVMRMGGGADAVYGVGMLGAWAYYLRRATTLRQGVEGFFKGMFWPAFLVYEVLVILNKA
jgi:hypothetical protein